MRIFIVISLFATVFAAPQGYNYQQNALQFTTAAGAREGHNFLQEALQNTKLMQTLLGSQSSFTPTIAQNQYQAPQQQLQVFAPRPQPVLQYQQQQQFQTPAFQQQPAPSFLQQQPAPSFLQQQPAPSFPQKQQAPIITKDIYVHVAPDEPEERRPQIQVPVAPPRKHYRIVFIKAPSPSISTSALRIQQAPSEEKTIIYVLTKKPDTLDLQAALQEAAPKQPSKPEVYFIKYKTQEEAQHAQRTIQAQYDQLGGTTQISDEGVAPVTSVIGSLDQQQGSSGSSKGIENTGFGTASTSGINNKYLPPISRI